MRPDSIRHVSGKPGVLINRLKYTALFGIVMCLICIMAGCSGSDNSEDGENPTEAESTSVKTVSSPEEFSGIGLYLDVQGDSEEVTDVSYSISGDIAIVDFRFKGVRTELRGSCKYKKYELAGIEDTSNGDMVVTQIQGCNATYYTLNPGRIIFWDDGTINYSMYVSVTATDEVVDMILECVVFENRYEDREDVQEQIDEGSREFADKIVTVFAEKDLNTLADMISYPQETGNAQSMASEQELLALDPDELFTDILIQALTDGAEEHALRMSEDGTEYIIGSNYKNVHFKAMEGDTFLITKINN